MVSAATYTDIAVISATCLSVVFVILFFARTAKKVLWYMVKWAVAFVILQAFMSALNMFPAYGVLRDALYTAFKRSLFSTAGAAAEPAFTIFKNEVKKMAKEYITNEKSTLDGEL